MPRKKKDDYEEITEEDEGDMFRFNFDLSSGAKRTIVALVIGLLGILFTLSIFNAAGPAGEAMIGFAGKAVGLGKYIMPLVCFVVAFFLLRTKMPAWRTATKIIGTLGVFLCVLALLHLLPYAPEDFGQVADDGRGGGHIGSGLAWLVESQFGKVASAIIFVLSGAIAAIFALNKSLVGIGDKVPEVKVPRLKRTKDGENIEEEYEEGSDDEEWEEDGDVYEDDEDWNQELKEQAHGTKKDAADDEIDWGDGEWDDAEEGAEDEYEEEDGYEEEYEEEQPSKAQAILSGKKKKEREREYDPDAEWELPPLRLLARGGTKAKGGDVEARATVIQDTFANFGINMELEDIVTGPTVTQFSFRPPSGVKLTKITALSADLALALAAHPIRIEAPIPGKSLVGIEVPNKETAMVRMREIVNTDEFEADDKPLLLALGEDVNGEHVIENLAKMPHLLVAGATGAGKSVTVNSILISLLYKNSPEDLKLILVDPKRVELSLYNGIPHLLSDVITDNGKVLNALKWAVGEMERRYKILQDVGTRDLITYKEKRLAGETLRKVDPETGTAEEVPLENLPIIVVVIDEMADLMASHGKEVEGVIVRLAQMSRAVGIHLIVSTQRPSVEVITGTIKANLPTRIALRVATGIDSRTIIDTPGAEKLVGHGDMLYVGTNSASPRRLQGVFIDEGEVKKVIDFIKKQAKANGFFDIEENFDGEGEASAEAAQARGVTSVDFDNVATTASAIGESNADQDPMFEDAKKAVIEAGKASTSYIQRRLRVGYSRAARLIDELEDQGVIGPADGAKPRQILVGKGDEGEMDYDEPMEAQAERDKWQA